jgi:hypothetical protein
VGRLIRFVWQHDPTIYAPAKYKRACAYEAFVPDPLAHLDLALPAGVAGIASEAEAAIGTLNAQSMPVLKPLGRLLLRTESIASSKVEGMQLGIRELARAEARVETGRRASPTALEILDNIDAMQLAVHEAGTVDRFTIREIVAIHRRLMEHAVNRSIAGQIRTRQNWVGGNDYNPCGADFVPPPAGEVGRLLTDLCDAVNDELLPPIVQAALVHAQFETIHPFDDGNGRTGRALIHVILRRRGVANHYVPPIRPSNERGLRGESEPVYRRVDRVSRGSDHRVDRVLRRDRCPVGASGIGVCSSGREPQHGMAREARRLA